MKKYLFALLVLISCSSLYSHPAILKLIYTSNYEKAEKKILKAIAKDSNNFEMNYAFANLYNQKGYTHYNTIKSYEFFKKAKIIIGNLSAKKVALFNNKYYINPHVIDSQALTVIINAYHDANLNNTVASCQGFIDYFIMAPKELTAELKNKRDSLAFQEASDINSYESFQNYLKLYPDSKLKNDAINKRDILLFEQVRAFSSVEAINKFISEYPSSTIIETAIKLRDSIAYENVCKINTVDEYQKYIENYGSSKNIELVIRRRDILAYQTTLTINTLDAFDTYLEKYPNSVKKLNAVYKRDSIAFVVAVKNKSIDAFKIYVLKYPYSKQIEKATLIRDSLLFIEASKINTIESYNDFVINYPGAISYKFAINRRDSLAYRKTLQINNIAAFEQFISDYPNSKQIEKAKKMKQVLSFVRLGNIEIMDNDIGRMDFTSAQRIISELGYGWRLPTIEEFIYINEYEYKSKSTDSEDKVFTGFSSEEQYLSSSISLGKRIMWDKGEKKLIADGDQTPIQVRCVRSVFK